MTYRIQQFGIAVGIISLAFAWYGLLSGNDALASDGIIVSLSGLAINIVGRFLNR